MNNFYRRIEKIYKPLKKLYSKRNKDKNTLEIRVNE